MGNRKALFFDIDGTLLSEGKDRKVPESARKALLQAREKGHLVFVNTGRTWCETKEIRHLIDADGWLCGCGTYLMAEGEVIYDWRIAPERGAELIKLIRDCGMDGVLEGVEACYMQKAPSPASAVEQCRQDFSALGIVSEKTWDDEGISFSKFCLVTDENSCLERFKEETREDLEVIDRGSTFVEVVPREHSKAAAIERILRQYGLSLEDASEMCIRDSYMVFDQAGEGFSRLCDPERKETLIWRIWNILSFQGHSAAGKGVQRAAGRS